VHLADTGPPECLGAEWRRSGQQLVEQDPEGIHIRARVNVGGAGGLLWTHVRGSAEKYIRARHARFRPGRNPYESEVEKLDRIGATSEAAQHDITGFDVSVNQSEGVGFGQRAA